MRTPQEEHEQTRKKLWCNAWLQAANNTSITQVPAIYADAALKAFDERFNKPIYTVEE